jgi:hypothetical protein
VTVFHTVSTSTLSYRCRSEVPILRILCHGRPGQSRSASSPSCLADEQKLALDCRNGLRIFSKRSQIHAKFEMNDHVDAVENILQGKCWIPKRQLRPLVRLGRQLAP